MNRALRKRRGCGTDFQFHAKEAQMNWNQIEGNWTQLKGRVREQWGKLTAEKCELLAGDSKEACVKDAKRNFGGS
jgi:uncharacterized protein YjbJ (UPF0337 family)